jgi:hypothetical protein
MMELRLTKVLLGSSRPPAWLVFLYGSNIAESVRIALLCHDNRLVVTTPIPISRPLEYGGGIRGGRTVCVFPEAKKGTPSPPFRLCEMREQYGRE